MAPGILMPDPAYNYFHNSHDFSSTGSTPDTRSDASNQGKIEPIAVVGLSLKFPEDATSAEAFWKMIVEKRSAMTDIPADRLEMDSFYGKDKNRNDNISVRGGHFLKENPSLFDAPFFSITSAEAASMDVQQRALLETTYRALENAGMPLETVNGSKTSVHTGSFADDYRIMTLKDQEGLPKHAATGASISILANRLSWFFNFTGPSVHLDSACSSSMMALDMACQGLRNGDSNMAIVGGSNTTWALEPYLILANMNFLSPDSRCYSFDHRANGYARGEGFGVLVLKRLVDAIKDGDSIRAVIRSTGSNSDGRTPGITQPSRDAQERLIKETYEKAGLDLKATRFFEAHGTGTPVGDPIEAGAIGGAFGKHRSPDEPLYVGAVKSNIGHLEGASGVAGVIKTILALEKGVIPPNTNFEQLNPKIDAPSLNLRFPTQAMPWPTRGLRRASINSFGFGGSNAHAVLDDAYNFLESHGLRGFHHTVQEPPSPDQLIRALIAPALPLENSTRPAGGAELKTEQSRPNLLVWSAADEGGLSRLAESYSAHFKALSLASGQDVGYISDLAYTLAVRRSALPWKSFAVTHSLSQLQNAGVSFSKAVRSSRKLGLGYIFTGQGAQFAGMGRELLAYPIYKRTLQRAELYLHDMGCPWSLMDEFLKGKGLSNVNGPEFSQPLCTALQIALVELLRSFNITPNAVVGHSSGEIAAAYCMGALSLRSACRVAYSRGRLAAQLAKTAKVTGSMVAVGLPESEVGPYIRRVAQKFGHVGIVVACVNSPKNVTVSGDDDQIDALKEFLDQGSIFARKLQVEVAYHSPHMNQIADEYLMAMGILEEGEVLPGCQLMVSSVMSKPVTVKELCQADYWVRNMTSPVQFGEAVKQLASASAKFNKKKLGGSSREQVTVYNLLELGPHSALARPTRDILRTVPRGGEITYASTLTRNVSALDTTLVAAGQLYCLGYPVKVAGVNHTEATKAVSRISLTDLPEYPFDHSQGYWHESRISKDLRLRKHPRQDLLGTQSLDWNPMDARWRKFIRISETPWVEDHVVNGATIYPAAGMLVMALEGVRQLTDSSRTVKGYLIKDATFQRALNIPLTQEGVESQLCIRPLQDAFDKDSPKYDFKIYMLEDNTWGENCRGTIHIEYDTDDKTEINRGYESAARLRHYQGLYQKRIHGCKRQVESHIVYDYFQAMGLNFGTAFRTLRNISCCDNGDVVAEIGTFPWTSHDDMNHPQPHLIHPTTLDGLIQLALVGLTRGAKDLIPATVPTRVTNLWLAASGLTHPETASLQASSNYLSKGYRQTESSMFAINKAGHLLASVSVLETTNVDQKDLDSNVVSNPRQLCYNMDWEPDVDLLGSKQIQSYCRSDVPVGCEPVDFFQDLGFFLFWTISKTLPLIDLSKTDESRRHYVDWMKLQVERFSSGQLLHARPDWSANLDDTIYHDAVRRRIETFSSEGKFYVEVARNLLPILQGEVDPLVILFQEDLAKSYYSEISARLSSQFAKLINLLCHKNPGLKVLEIGAGTGSTTSQVLAPLFAHGADEQGTPRCSQYDFTDISPSFFEKAQDQFRDYSSRLKYKVLDIEKDIFQQGFEAGSYDLIIAANVLHATKHLDVTLQNVRALLKPGGKLLLLEQTGDFARGGFAFGLLPGWWLSSDNYRTWGPTMTPQKWDKVLKLNGFTGTEAVLNDYYDSECQELSIMVSTVLDTAPPQPPLPKTMIIAAESSVLQQDVARNIRDTMYSKCSPTCEIVSLDGAGAVQDVSERFCIFLLELDAPFAHALDQESFDCVQSVLTSAQGIVWVSKGGGVSAEMPEYQVVDGLLRTLRTENAMLKAVTLALDPSRLSAGQAAETIFEVLEKTFSNEVNGFETEYIEKAGMLHINRVIEANYMNQFIQKVTRPQESRTQAFGAAGTPPLALNFETPGLLDSSRFIEDKDFTRPLLEDQVEIEVKATGVNFMDCLTALGRINQTEIGGECAGIVSRAGDQCDLKTGDRVCGIVFDCFKTYARCNAQTVMKIPDELSFIDAAALPMTYTTAHHALVETGRLQKGEKVLIHAAAGGTGQSAIQIAKSIGAEIFVTVGSEDKKHLIMTLYDIPSDHIFYSRNTTFAQGILRMTQNRGVDVILNSLAGEGLSASWECIASFGRFVEIGKRDIQSHAKLDMFQFAKNVSFNAVDIFGMSRERPDLVRRSLLATIALVAEKKVRASQPLKTYSVSQIEDAFRYMQSGKNVGKVVVDMKKEDQVRTVLENKPSYSFEKNATYLIAGGFGGLARRTARWMASRGAKNLLLLSRSGPRTDAATVLLEELRDQGVHVEAPACDITSSEALARTLSECGKTMPPIKGCIQGAMVLKDAMFEKMTLTDWKTATAPKVEGSRNLHNLLPSGLDFFIMLSSVVGIHGSIGQANYASGGTFQDSLAHHRISKGEKATALDLGWMASDGIIAESEFLSKTFETSGIMMPIDSTEYLALLDYYCNPLREVATPLASQMMVGLETPASLRARDADVPALLQRPTFRYMHQIGLDENPSRTGSAEGAVNYAVSFANAASAAEAGEVVVEGLAKKLSKALSIPPGDIDTSKPLHSYGVDSLLAVELRSWFAKELKSDVAIFEIMGGSSFAAVAATVTSKSHYRQASWE